MTGVQTCALPILIIIADSKLGKTVIGVEAKVNETFGNDTVGEYYLKSRLKLLNGEGTKADQRIEGLIKALFKAPVRAEVYSLMYQLLTAAAGTIAEAATQQANAAVFMVQTIDTHLSKEVEVQRNDVALDSFVSVISKGNCDRLEYGQIHGPVNIPGNDSYIQGSIPFFISKIKTKV